MSIWSFAKQFAPDVPESSQLSLGEGFTPMVRSRRIGPAMGVELFFKLETANPTGSYKDRFAAAAIADMLRRGCSRCVATSSGNTGAALAAYCAIASLQCEIAIVETAPAEKLQQMLAYGATLIRIKGFGLDPDVTRKTMAAVERRASAPGAALQISAFCKSPEGMAGVQTIGYELCEQLDGKPAHIFVPAGGGGLTLAVARGIAGSAASVHCVQPSGNPTIAGPLRRGGDRAEEVPCSTRISGLQVAAVLDGHDVIAACRASGGTGFLVDDDAVYGIQARLAREEGIFAEPAGAVALAAAVQAVTSGELPHGWPIVCIVTGSGFKDQPSVARMTATQQVPLIELDAFQSLP